MCSITLHNGSPPRVRGKRADDGRRRREARLTPACAGKTNTHNPCCNRVRAHPRVCGENTEEFVNKVPVTGSPPRVRGKQDQYVECITPGRLTPACAGKTTDFKRATGKKKAHPRVCGENRLCLRINVHPEWLTPACAGKTSMGRPAQSLAPAHPRVCGENVIWPVFVFAKSGSPPRVRGKRSH